MHFPVENLALGSAQTTDVTNITVSSSSCCRILLGRLVYARGEQRRGHMQEKGNPTLHAPSQQNRLDILSVSLAELLHQRRSLERVKVARFHAHRVCRNHRDALPVTQTHNLPLRAQRV